MNRLMHETEARKDMYRMSWNAIRIVACFFAWSRNCSRRGFSINKLLLPRELPVIICAVRGSERVKSRHDIRTIIDFVDVDVESVLAQAERLFASFSNFYFANYNIKLDYFYA